MNCRRCGQKAFPHAQQHHQDRGGSSDHEPPILGNGHHQAMPGDAPAPANLDISVAVCGCLVLFNFYYTGAKTGAGVSFSTTPDPPHITLRFMPRFARHKCRQKSQTRLQPQFRKHMSLHARFAHHKVDKKPKPARSKYHYSSRTQSQTHVALCASQT